MKAKKKALPRGIREAVKNFQYLVAVPVLYLVASLLPGDRIGFNVVGTIGLLVIVGIVDAVVSLPLLYLAKRLESPAVKPVPVREEW